MSEPKTIEDLRYMRETSGGWFDGRIKSERVRDYSNDYVEGELASRSVNVYIAGRDDNVRVEEHEHYVTEVKGPRSCSLRTETRTLGQYTFEEFRASGWWRPTMEAWKDGCTDASELGIAFEHDTEHTYTEVTLPCRYRDFLGNDRTGKGVDNCSVTVDKGAQLTIRFNGETWDGHVEDAMELLSEAQAFRDAGVAMEDGRLTVKVEVDDDDR